MLIVLIDRRAFEITTAVDPKFASVVDCDAATGRRVDAFFDVDPHLRLEIFGVFFSIEGLDVALALAPRVTLRGRVLHEIGGSILARFRFPSSLSN